MRRLTTAGSATMKLTETTHPATRVSCQGIRRGVKCCAAVNFMMRRLMPTLLMLECLCACRTVPPSSTTNESHESLTAPARRAGDIHVCAVAVIGPLLDLTYTNYSSQGIFDRVPVPEGRAAFGANACEWNSRNHLAVAISGPPEALCDISRFLEAQRTQHILVDVFDAATGIKLTPTDWPAFALMTGGHSEGEIASPPRANWELTLMTNELGVRILILPIDLEEAPTAQGRVLLSLQPMEKIFLRPTGDASPVVVDTRLVEFTVSEP